ncbi:endonuclease V [Paenibacillus sp. FSL P4-0338]|uniref:endonuclease V n=1 Tax=unclassified Paenibacillus TaxID=185978 RepID=UPI0003E27F31|nr:endonuclease V [Paenibacillus sp. FSL R7-269]ETT54536.1 Endonuclease V [Paenibacillus sp. FSL R7-269]
MIIAVDVYYEENQAKSVGVIFQGWEDSAPLDVIVSYTENPRAYEPGSFYKRELPCIRELLKLTDTNQIHTIVVDGYVYLDQERKPGLGHYVYTDFSGRIPVIGVAKNAFHDNDNEALVKKICRGTSAKPLYITSIGIEPDTAARHIQRMHGEYRFPYLLKLLDKHTKEARG